MKLNTEPGKRLSSRLHTAETLNYIFGQHWPESEEMRDRTRKVLADP